MLDWTLNTFILEDGELHNPDHAHLIAARIGILWAGVDNSRNGRKVLGQAEFRPPGGSMGRWQRTRAQYQLHSWFGGELDFLLTFDADYAASCSDREFCALVEHELYHCGQAKDEFGAPKFGKDSGIPVFCMRGHDVEEFVGVVRRYGPGKDVSALIDAANEWPEVTGTQIMAVCGTCQS